MDADVQDIPHSSCNARDSNVLEVIEEEGLAKFTFDGLKRRLGVHPETLSRTLDRLEEQGIIEKGLSGYKVTSKVRESRGLHSAGSRGSCAPLLQTLLPPDLPMRQVVSEVGGKWFGVLRWLGYSEEEGKITLKWITEDGGVQVDANFSEGLLTIEAKMLREKDMSAAMRASYQLIGHIAKLYSRPVKIRPVAYFGSYFMPA
jgi:DNA-binding transcriptional ArsR family regulator